MFIALRIFDSYITSSLGLPRSVRVTGPNHIIPTNATFIESSEMLTASNANVELLEIMSTARESMFFTGTTTPGQPKIVDAALLREMEDSLDRWAQKYRVFARITPNVSTVSVKYALK